MASNDPLVLAREVQSLRLELEAARSQAAELQDVLERQRAQEGGRVQETVRTLQEELMTQVAAPVAQLLTQTYLLETEGKPIQARDLLAVFKRMLRALTDAGLTVDGSPGDAAGFDPDKHEPLGDFAPSVGDPVVLRMAGIGYGGRRLRRAGVVSP